MPGLLKQVSDYFNLSRTERRGLIVLIGLLMLIVIAEITLPFFIRINQLDNSSQEAEVKAFLAEQTKLKKLVNTSKKNGKNVVADDQTSAKQFYFDPNNLPDYKWLELGLTEKQIRMINNYKSAGGKFEVPEDLAKIYSISEADFERLKPWIVIERTSTSEKKSVPVMHLRPFNPNKITAVELESMGMDKGIIANIINYRGAGGFFNRPEDLQKLYSINDSLFTVLQPFILIEQNKKTPADSALYTSKEILSLDINTADTLDLQQLQGIGPSFSRRIVKYRELLGGYYSKAQLLEVYGMDSTRYSAISSFLIINNDSIKKININTAGVKDLIKHPYIEFYLAKSIIKHREEVGNYTSLEEVLDAKLIYKELYDKIKPYLTI